MSPRWSFAVLVACIGCSTQERLQDASPTASPATDGSEVEDATPPNLPIGSGDDASIGDASTDGPAEIRADSLPGTSAGCPDDMVRVRGQYCPGAEQICLEYHEDYRRERNRKKATRAKGDEVEKGTVSERCLKYREPTECLSKERRPMDFCVDRYEWPNKKGEVPALLISWLAAKKTCEEIGKRLCTEDEFNFACEGEQMLPYTYGFVRDPTACNIDRPYRKRERTLKSYERCMSNPACKAELERLDQRQPAGSMARCVSPFGVYDLNGNINEWVYLPGKKYPDRSGLKGGWWGPVRGRCRPTVDFHKEEDYGYEEGFRCCKDAGD